MLVIDFETYYDKEYSLSKLTLEEYVRDPRFEVIGVAVYDVKNGAEYWLTEQEFIRAVKNKALVFDKVLAHNTAFDGAILSWRYGIRANLWLDTLSMARSINGTNYSNSLESLAEQFGIGKKGTAVKNTLGKHAKDFSDAEYFTFGQYAINDCKLCYEIFKHIIADYSFPISEIKVIDVALRMFLEPRIILNQQLLLEAYNKEVESLNNLLQTLGVTENDLASDAKFAAILSSLGVEPPKKISPRTGKETFAFAKTDVQFQELINSSNETVALLAEARLKTKSTILRTRALRLYEISKRGPLPVPLSYYGSHTGRFAAMKGQAINMQNLKRGSLLRKAIQAPDGYVFVVADLKQIEFRVLAALAEYDEMLSILQQEDPYATFGAILFGIPGLTKETHPELRQAAKSAVLGCGYGLGYVSLAAQLLAGFMGAPPQKYGMEFILSTGYNVFDVENWASRTPDIDKLIKEIPHTCTDQQLIMHLFATKIIVDKFRNTAKPITEVWRTMQACISWMISGTPAKLYNILEIGKEKIRLPNGMYLRYPNICLGENSSFVYGVKNKKKLYGGLITENVIQALARIIMTDAMLRISKRYNVVLTVHDEIVSLVPESEVSEAEKWITSQMTVVPVWLPKIPLAVDVGSGKVYGDVK